MTDHWPSSLEEKNVEKTTHIFLFCFLNLSCWLFYLYYKIIFKCFRYIIYVLHTLIYLIRMWFLLDWWLVTYTLTRSQTHLGWWQRKSDNIYKIWYFYMGFVSFSSFLFLSFFFIILCLFAITIFVSLNDHPRHIRVPFSITIWYNTYKFGHFLLLWPNEFSAIRRILMAIVIIVSSIWKMLMMRMMKWNEKKTLVLLKAFEQYWRAKENHNKNNLYG